VRKSSLGAEETVGWTYHKNALAAAQALKADGDKLFALEEAEKAISINSAVVEQNEKYVLIAGNEVTGVDPALLSLCDQILFIPMRGSKKSFNVAIATGIAVAMLAHS
jgi:23S rRNA (guanosine2251-2'-O)-methyltransferase